MVKRLLVNMFSRNETCDENGLLTYSKSNWYSGDEIKMDNGEGVV